jgi:hypothetical protein
VGGDGVRAGNMLLSDVGALQVRHDPNEHPRDEQEDASQDRGPREIASPRRPHLIDLLILTARVTDHHLRTSDRGEQLLRARPPPNWPS